MAKINRKNKTYKLNNLPELMNNSFVFNNKTGITGSMFSRPVTNTFRIYKHYAIVYGFDKNNVLWMIENNVNGVECITFEDFLNSQNYFKVEAYVNNPFTSQLILQRAKSKSNAIYFPNDFNCEHFVNYCYTGISHSEQVQVTKSVFDVVISFLELKVGYETKNEELLNSINETRKILDIKRSPEFQKSLGEMIKKDGNSQ
jgi:hypothetical protein